MPIATGKTAPRLVDALKKIFFLGASETAVSPLLPPAPAPASALPYTQEQQRELEALFAQLFKKKSLVTSGKLQMLGFDKIKMKMGTDWPRLQAIVFEIADAVIRSHLISGDVYLRYKEDTYILIFGSSSLENGWARATAIAEEIGRRLAETGQEYIKVIQVDPHVRELQTAALSGKSLPDTLAAISNATCPATNLGMEPARERPAAPITAMPKTLKCAYYPLWDVRQKALTTYLCKLDDNGAASPLDRDLDTLRAAKVELQKMHDARRQMTLIVPVRHGTLFNADSSQKYQMVYRDIPDGQRKFLVFLIINFMEGLPEKSAFWFIPALKTTCRQIFAELPLRAKTDLAALKAQGLDGLGVTVDPNVDEVATIGQLRNFSEQAMAANVAQTFVLNMPSLSLATTVSCMGFAYIGGPVIHAAVPRLDKPHDFRYAELFMGGKPVS